MKTLVSHSDTVGYAKLRPYRDERLRQEFCDVGRPVPMNRIDLLIPRNPPSHSTYYRPPKYPKPLPRPATAMDMINNLEQSGYVGQDLEVLYTTAVRNPLPVNNAILVREENRAAVAIRHFQNPSNYGRVPSFAEARRAIPIPVAPTISRPDVVVRQFVDMATATDTVNALGEPEFFRAYENLERARAEQMRLQQEYQAIMKEQSDYEMDEFLSDAEERLQTATVPPPPSPVPEPVIQASSSKSAPATPSSPKVRMSADKKVSTPSLSGNISPGHYGRLLAPGRFTRANYTPRTPKAEGGASQN